LLIAESGREVDMRRNQIKSKIQRSIKDEERSSRLASTIRAVARNNSANPTKAEVQDVVDFVKQYVQHVPYYLEQGLAAARQIGLADEMNRMASELEAYWFQEEDLIPDRLGLLGIMDDAYASLLLLQSLSDYCKATIGRPLLAHDLTSANRFIRQLIGEPTASILDQRVGITLGQAMMNQLVSRFAMSGLTVGGGPDPTWGGVTLDEYVDIQMGSLGIV
jgi:uncharacterized membrane protein YkvA (DUF1232 family)